MVGYCVIHRKYNNRWWVLQGAESSSLLDLVCDPICQPSNEDEDEMKMDSCYWTDPKVFRLNTHLTYTSQHAIELCSDPQAQSY